MSKIKHTVIITKKPERSGKDSIPDGAINGNGDLAVILGNCENGIRIYIAKCDMWQGCESADAGGIKPLAHIDIPINSDLYNNYYCEQDMDCGEIRCNFESEHKSVKLTIRVNKTENSIVIESTGTEKILPVLKTNEKDICGVAGKFEENNIKGVYRFLADEKCEYETNAYAVMREINSGLFYIFAATNHDCENPKELALKKAENITEEKCAQLKALHYEQWQKFWSESSFSISDEDLEMRWYASQYFLAVCAGNIKFPPGIFGNFITIENVSWHGDYHLNYNYQAPFYAVCSSNHVELTECYHAPLEEFIEKGRKAAKVLNCRGVFFPVGIAPKGLYSEYQAELDCLFERLCLGQRSNNLHAADIMIFRWKATKDIEYARNHAYPYIKECLEFFEDYATYENGRYSIEKDAIHEIPYYKKDLDYKYWNKFINDKNNVLTLGLLRLSLEAAIDMAKTLGIDEEKQKDWQSFLEKLSPFPTYLRFFQKVFRYTESGMAWNDSGDVGLQHIYPCGCVGLSSDEDTLKIARNTFNQNRRWFDGNAVSSIFPCAVRLGINPKTIIKKLRKHNSKFGLPNLLYSHGGGCLENCSINATTLNEMALQSHQGLIRIFPVWDSSLNCEYKNLRADGAFLVSASIKNGEIGAVTIVSEKGTALKLLNPFEKSAMEINGKNTVTKDEIIEISTNPKDTIIIKKA